MKNSSSVNIKQIINIIPAEKFEQLSAITKINHQVKKLSGEVMFKLLLMSVLSSERLSLRVMEDLYKSKRFRLLANLNTDNTTRHTSLSDRLIHINADFFEQLFEFTYQQLADKYQPDTIMQHRILRYDSTLISASAKLLKKGIINGRPNKKTGEQVRQVKLSIGFDGLFVRKMNFYNEQRYAVDDQALRKTILGTKKESREVVVFDRGIKSRQAFADIDKQQKSFVTRINPSKGYDVIEPLSKVKGTQTKTLLLMSDEKVYLYHGQHERFKKPFRLIRSQSLQTGEIIFFVTNLWDLDAATITEIYKSRWDIEVFFKFLKQEMNLKHFSSYSENGIKVVMYVTLIAAMLILLFKKLNKISSYKRAKTFFIEELDTELIREIVLWCGGNPDQSQYLRPT